MQKLNGIFSRAVLCPLFEGNSGYSLVNMYFLLEYFYLVNANLEYLVESLNFP